MAACVKANLTHQRAAVKELEHYRHGRIFFAGTLKMDSGEDCLIFEVETVVITRAN